MIYLIEKENELKGFYLKSNRDNFLKNNGGKIIKNTTAERKYGFAKVSEIRINVRQNHWKEF